MTRKGILAMLVLLGFLIAPVRAGVVINEIFYHAPNDLDDLEYIELHNPDAQAVDLSGWQFNRGIHYQFPPNTKIEANGYLVLAQNAERFQEFYGFLPSGVFTGVLANSGERVDLVDARGRTVDSVRYRDEHPWPPGPDGYSASLERINPFADSNLPQNWASSPLSDELRPMGTPGKVNASFSANLPPIISNVRFTPKNPAPGESINVEADVRDSDGVGEVRLLYRLAGSGFEKEETIVPMSKQDGRRFGATIPGQEANQLVRFRILAIDQKGARRFYPAENEPRPALSVFVHQKMAPGSVPFIFIINVGEAERDAAAEHLAAPNRRSFSPGDQMKTMARMQLELGMDLASIWFDLNSGEPLPFERVRRLAEVFEVKSGQRESLITETLGASNLGERLKEAPAMLKAFHADLAQATQPFLDDEQKKKLAAAQESQIQAVSGGPMKFEPEAVLKRFVNLEGAFFNVSMHSDIQEPRFNELKSVYQSAVAERAELVNAARALMQGQGEAEDLMDRISKLNRQLEKQTKPLLTAHQEKELARWRRGSEFFFMPGRGRVREPRLPQGRSAFVQINQQSGEPELFDFVNVTERNAGLNVYFHNDRPLRNMSSINLVFESNDRFSLAEALAYELYRRAGNAAPASEFVRLWVDGKLIGYHLLIEQPNRSFLRRNKLDPKGNLYKILWYERGVVGQHEKKTNRQSGHEDIVELVELLGKNKENPDAQWAAIKKHFNVEQVINYFAVNTCLSHWDGFFNNYFAYHDAAGSGKWEMYPWDQDKTWGYYDGIAEGEVFYNMPLTFGMEGDRRPNPSGGSNVNWWRPGGYFSRPLLANPQFRKLYLARTKEILETIYTEQTFFPLIDALGARLQEDVQLRAAAGQEEPDVAIERLKRNLDSLKEHLVKRKRFLLDQDEIKTAGRFVKAELNR
jgi:hypothetical protein